MLIRTALPPSFRRFWVWVHCCQSLHLTAATSTGQATDRCCRPGHHKTQHQWCAIKPVVISHALCHMMRGQRLCSPFALTHTCGLWARAKCVAAALQNMSPSAVGWPHYMENPKPVKQATCPLSPVTVTVCSQQRRAAYRPTMQNARWSGMLSTCTAAAHKCMLAADTK